MPTDKFNKAALVTPEGVGELMASSASKKEWDENCDAVQAANEGQFPDFWVETVHFSGLADRKFAQFKP
jgi:hypothetical protein